MTQQPHVAGLFDRLRTHCDDRHALQQAAQLAIEVEFTTIPAYLTAMYSIQDVDSKAYRTLRSVVMEEMFHLNQAANTLVAIGGQPKFTGSVVPQYPCYLPHANPNTTPYVGLYRASPEVFENVFVAIEEPAPPHAPPEGDNYSTIAQLYDALRDGLKSYSGSTPLFEQHPQACQRTDIYIGKFGGKPVLVTDLESANFGITEILQQGEGSVPEGQSLVPLQPFATYNQYGQRSDGTYGPIIGTPLEMSHFIKFRQVALDSANFPPTYPIIGNPRRVDFTSRRALHLAEVFDFCYSLMLDALEKSFHAPAPGQTADPFFAVVLPLMHAYLPTLARLLMTTPMRDDGDASVGPNAAPTWHYTAGVTLSQLHHALQPLFKLDDFSSDELAALAQMVNSVEQLKSVHPEPKAR